MKKGGYLGLVTFYVTWGLGYILHPGSLEHANELGRRPVGARPMHPTLSPALVRTRAARWPVAIMISLKSLKAGAQIEWSSLGYFGGLELKTARAATLPSSSTCPAAPVASGYHLRRRRRCWSHLHLGSRVCRACTFGTSGMFFGHEIKISVE